MFIMMYAMYRINEHTHRAIKIYVIMREKNFDEINNILF